MTTTPHDSGMAACVKSIVEHKTSGMSDDEWAEVQQELPTETDAVLLNYLKGRDALIAEERKQRSDHHFRQSLSPIARRACHIVSRIRSHEQRIVWTASPEEQLGRLQAGEPTLHPGMSFTLAKPTLERTLLWRIVSRMPKGALLDAHCDAMVDFDWLLNVVMNTPGMHIAGPDGHLGREKEKRERRVMIRFREADADSGKDMHAAAAIWSDRDGAYKADTFVPLAKAASLFPGGRSAFQSWLKSRCTLSQTGSVQQHHGNAEVWRKFFSCSAIVGPMLYYEPIWRAFLHRLMSVLAADGVSWAEIRFSWPLDYCRTGHETPEPDCTAMFKALDEEMAAFKETDEGTSFWGLRMIWTTVRDLPSRSVVQDMDNCIATKMAFPHLIAGYDLVGSEDAGRPLRDLLPELFWFRKQCAAERLTLPFFFHAGETLGSGSPSDHNLFDALLLGTRRIGHAFSLYKHPTLISAVRERRILVESCPISNKVLGLCGSILSHPLPALLARGVPCALYNGDPAILGHDTTGITHEFWQALQGWDDLGLAGLGGLAENSMRWACFEDQGNEAWTADVRAASLGTGVKADRMKEWGVQWERFCWWVVDEFGEEWGEEGDEEGEV